MVPCTCPRRPATRLQLVSPPGSAEGLDSFETEWKTLKDQAVGTLCLGDLNIHHRSWLRHSNGETAEGRHLQDICHRCNFAQLVREPTREEYLLDLAISDLHELKIEVLPRIADHRLVRVSMKMQVPRVEARERKVWDFKKAKWDELSEALSSNDWRRHAASPDVDTCVRGVVGDIMKSSQACIPTRKITEHKATHEWLTPSVLVEVQKKVEAAGTDRETAAAERCSTAILEEYGRFVQRKRTELQDARRGSKAWWREARKLARRSGPVSNTPALKSSAGWVKEPKAKADLFKQTFTSKFVVPDGITNDYSELPSQPAIEWEGPCVKTQHSTFSLSFERIVRQALTDCPRAF